MGFFTDDKTEDQKEYERGQRDGAQATVLDELGMLGAQLFPPSSEAYRKGWENGVKNKKKDRSIWDSLF